MWIEEVVRGWGEMLGLWFELQRPLPLKAVSFRRLLTLISECGTYKGYLGVLQRARYRADLPLCGSSYAAHYSYAPTT